MEGLEDSGLNRNKLFFIFLTCIIYTFKAALVLNDIHPNHQQESGGSDKCGIGKKLSLFQLNKCYKCTIFVYTIRHNDTS